MIRSVYVVGSFLVLTASVALTAHSAPAGSAVPAAASATPKPAPSAVPQKPGMPADVKGALDKCKPDPKSGQMRCPTPGAAPPAGPLGASCTTAAGAPGIWVVTSSSSPTTCAPAGAACYTPTGGVGKVWGTGDKMVCGAKGDSCVNDKGGGRVFVIGGNVACLSVGDSCTCPNNTAGCKVVGLPTSPNTFECAKRDVTCPATAPATLQINPSNGTSNGAVQISLKGTAVRPTTTDVYCDYLMTNVAPAISYSIPCHGAYANITDGRWRACTGADNKVEKQVACDKPSGALITAKSDSLGTSLNSSVAPTSMVAPEWKGSANDAARENAICNYAANSVLYTIRVPCVSPKKASYGAYICN